MNTIRNKNRIFGEALLELKKKSGLSYKQIAIKAGLSDAYLVNLVKGKNLPPKNENIIKIAKALDVEPEYFYVYRKRKFIEYIDKNRELLDDCLEQIKKIHKKTG